MGIKHLPNQDSRLGSVAIFGGGLAGMAAAWRLANRGHSVTLVERKPYLGGRAYSFIDRTTGSQLDNGQHVFLGCCTAYTQFLKEVGTLTLTKRQTKLRLEVYGPTGRKGVISSHPLPSPIHLFWSFLRYPHMGVIDKIRAIPALARIATERQRSRPALEQSSFYHWLRDHGQSQKVIRDFWDLFILPALNDRCRHVSATMGFMVFQEALLRNRHGANIGYASSGLSEVMGSVIGTKLKDRDVRLMLNHTAAEFLIGEGPNSGSMVTGVRLNTGEELTADWYLSALPPQALLSVLPEALRSSPQFEPAKHHTWSPIVNLHVWYDRPVADFEFAAFVGTPIQWIFNRSAITNSFQQAQHLAISLSGAWEFWPMSKRALEDFFLSELARILPRSRTANVLQFMVIKEQHATFQVQPSTAGNRLSATTPLSNLLLAGDWTDTGWPSTMEGAVRSGLRAAEIVPPVHEPANGLG